MVTLFVLNVAEFQPLVVLARGQPGVDVGPGPLGYLCIRASGELKFSRKALGFPPAVWYGAVTGGLIGRVAEFSRDTLRITEDS